MKFKKSIIALAAALSGALFTSGLPGSVFAQENVRVANVAAGEAVSYTDVAGGSQSVNEYTKLTGDNCADLTAGWYVADASFSTNKRVKAQGNVHLILCDGVTLTLKKGLTVENGGSLTIWQQSGKTGKLTATSSDDHVAAISVNDGSALTINGGTITATTKTGDAAGIGGDKGKASGNITINAGTMKATGASHGAGIGGGRDGQGKAITINGGTVEANGGDYAAGIGGGGDSGADQIIIRGGKVNAWGGTESAGIGSANKGHVNNIEITGGRVYAFGKKNAAGIGGGDGNEKNGTYGTITISGEETKVGAYGGAQAAGIGTGNDAKKNNGTINITDGAWVQAVGGSKSELFIDENDNVKRNWQEPGTGKYKEPYEEFYDGCEYGAGIGGGDLTPGGTINISGKTTHVEAYGAENAAGIGSGDKAGSIGNITIIDADVYARGGGMRDTYDDFNEGIRGNGGAGIGGGRQSGSEGTITIQGANVNARGAEYAAGIGGGDEGGFTKIIITDGANVTARGGKHGAGIGTGDVTDNGKKNAWKTGTIEIRGADTIVNAFGGDYGAAGIGGGEDGYGCKILIENIGMTPGAKGYVKAIGNENCAGIGGGSSRAFQSITLDNAVVVAAASYGAGIGTGGGKPGKSSDSPEKGGDIYIYNSAVVAYSAMGGAGIGGGIFSRADNIKIYGGVVLANGGAVINKNDLPALASLKADDLMNRTNFEADLLHTGNVFGESDTLKAALDNASAALTKDADTYLLDYSAKDKYYTGAGIGGGYKAAGGNIEIYDNAMISAATGVLTPDLSKKIKDDKKKNSASIGVGRDYTGNDVTKVTVYKEAAVTTAGLELNKSWYGRDTNAAWREVQHYDVVKSDIQAGQATEPETMARLNNTDYQLAVIQPGIAVTFDENGGSEVPDQVVLPGEKSVKAADPVREGYSFRGWRQVMEDGTTSFELYDFDKPVTEHTFLQAQWNKTGGGHKVIIEESYRDREIIYGPYKLPVAGQMVIVETTDVKMKGIIVTDDLGNEIKTSKSEYRMSLLDGRYVHDHFTFIMPDNDVYIKGIENELHKINIWEYIPEGAIVSSHEEAIVGTWISLYVNDVEGFSWETRPVYDSDGNKLAVGHPDGNRYIFKMPDSDVFVMADAGGDAEDDIEDSTGEAEDESSGGDDKTEAGQDKGRKTSVVKSVSAQTGDTSYVPAYMAIAAAAAAGIAVTVAVRRRKKD